MSRDTRTVRTTTVRWVAKPMGKERENGPHLGDLRAFVDECEGLPDGTPVTFIDGHLGESGRRDVTIQATVRESLAP